MPWLAATLPVADLARTALEALRSAARRAGVRGPLVDAPLDPARVAASFASDRLLRLDGEPWAGFARHSGFFATADGWVRTHANYPHHRARLLRILDLPDDASRDDLADHLAQASAQDVEDAAADAGAVAVRVRSESGWRASAPGRAAAVGPLVATTARADGRPARRAAAPLAGARVLDLTRVIAGPVATRTLALLGADVLRVDPPEPAEIAAQHLDTGQGKRSTLLDLRRHDDHARAQELLDAADVLVTGYRPGAIEAHGLRLPPGAVHARVSAWGSAGPWAGRRGFDSIVQAASGIALLESTDGVTPGALPAQALDHATGYLLVAGVLDALVERARDGAGRDVATSLARTAAWLLDAPGREPDHPPAALPPSGTTVTHGRVRSARPALPVDDYAAPARPWGGDPPRW
ncbi:CoA transferase family III [Isoptericola sp. CG 20/1183]|uniref:CoA transferase family III n=1 Tax=Isoptericola halotolerans TaxID=300560 RepID=A0ABX5EGB2_9MICO|nr:MULTISPECIES: CoA transferase [Isoptericola]PRZ08482.1 CoA transferase family III [Isoptericola halotolerans]PRZ11071.1 CoA transferase family III [Isoptericola sp. CG 20/1183]